MTSWPNASESPDDQFVAAKASLEEILRSTVLQSVYDLDDHPDTPVVGFVGEGRVNSALN